VKTCLTKAPVLVCPDFKETFELQTDASDDELRLVLTHKQEGEERVIALRPPHPKSSRTKLLGNREGVPHSQVGNMENAPVPGGVLLHSHHCPLRPPSPMVCRAQPMGLRGEVKEGQLELPSRRTVTGKVRCDNGGREVLPI
jgi:hypothetical protein